MEKHINDITDKDIAENKDLIADDKVEFIYNNCIEATKELRQNIEAAMHKSMILLGLINTVCISACAYYFVHHNDMVNDGTIIVARELCNMLFFVISVFIINIISIKLGSYEMNEYKFLLNKEVCKNSIKQIKIMQIEDMQLNIDIEKSCLNAIYVNIAFTLFLLIVAAIIVNIEHLIAISEFLAHTLPTNELCINNSDPKIIEEINVDLDELMSQRSSSRTSFSILLFSNFVVCNIIAWRGALKKLVGICYLAAAKLVGVIKKLTNCC